jgi:O-antigen/teichoic acid export membrane protein
LWILTTTVTTYFSVLDLGYSGAQIKFIAHYRAKRDATALNEILSTLFCVFSSVGVVMYLAAIVIAIFLGRLFQLSPDQVRLGRIVLLVVSANVALGTAVGVYGGIINGFQRYDLNNVVGAISSIVAAVVNVLVLVAGYGLVELVVATTIVRILTYVVYRANAYRVFPALRIDLRSFSRERLKEVTSFSIYILLIDWADKVNYSVDAIVIGMFLNTSAVALWSVGQRVAETTQRLTNQLNEVLFPNVVDNDTAARTQRLQQIFLVGTRLSLATVVPAAGALALLARPLLHAWVGAAFTGPELDLAVAVLRILAFTVIVRVGNSTASTLLKGAGWHRLLTISGLLTAAANLSLSVLWVRPYGLVGVAVGTLVPVTLWSLLVLFPAGCARVHLRIRRALAEAVWPAVWPGIIMSAVVLAVHPYAGASLMAVGLQAAVGLATYAITFLGLGTTPAERALLRSKLLEWRQAIRLPPAAVSEDA